MIPRKALHPTCDYCQDPCQDDEVIDVKTLDKQQKRLLTYTFCCTEHLALFFAGDDVHVREEQAIQEEAELQAHEAIREERDRLYKAVCPACRTRLRRLAVP